MPTVTANGANAGALEIQLGGGATEAVWALLEVDKARPVTRSLFRSTGVVFSLTTQAFAECLLMVGRFVLFNFAADFQMFVVSQLDTSKCSS